MRGKRLSLFRCKGMMVFLLLQTTIVLAQRVQLTWDRSTTPDLAYYGIYRSTDLNAAFTMINKVNYPDSTYIDAETKRNPRYYYVATAVDRLGNESGFSNIVEAKIQPTTAVQLRNFSVRAEDYDAILEWSIETVSNIFGFEVQRRQDDALEFGKIGFVNVGNATGAEKHYRFVDKNLVPGNYYYRLQQITQTGDNPISEHVRIAIGLPDEFHLYQNHPNPFSANGTFGNPATTISYSLPQNSQVDLTIYDVNGREVYKLIDEFQKAGRYEVTWKGVNSQGIEVPSGTYYYRIRTADHSMFRRMILVK